MSRDKPWLKMWTDWLADPKMDRLSLAEQGAWWRLVSLCHDCGHLAESGKPDGALVVAGAPLSLPEIMKSLKVTDEPDKVVFNQMVAKMTAAGSLHTNADIMFVTHYEERQRATTDTKEDRRRRQRDRRAAMKAAEEKREPEKSSSEVYIENQRREGDIETHAQTGNVKSVTRSEIVAEVTRLVIETHLEPLSELVADRIRQFADTYTGPLSWIGLGFKQAAVHKRRWAYVEKIIERWVAEGGPDGCDESGFPTNQQPTGRQRNAAARDTQQVRTADDLRRGNEQWRREHEQR